MLELFRRRSLRTGHDAAVTPLQADETTPSLPEGHRRLWGPFRHGSGFAFRSGVPTLFAGGGDWVEQPRQSRLVLFEDGVPLGPRHSLREAVEQIGGGRYLHWAEDLFFSASDNSDPGRNGRVYSWAVGARTPKLINFGSCNLHAAMWRLHGEGKADAALEDAGVTYSPAEHLSLARQIFSLSDIPERLRPYAYSAKPGSQPVLRRAAEGVDALVVEVSANTDIRLGSATLMRSVINDLIRDVIGAEIPEATPALQRWYLKGIVYASEASRQAAAQEALAFMRGTALDTEIHREILSEARGVRQAPEEMIAALAALRDLIGAPRLILLSAPNYYTPDGRGVSLAPRLFEDMRRVAQALDAPLIEVGQEVLAAGGEFAVLPDMIHLAPAFLQRLGMVILEQVEETA